MGMNLYLISQEENNRYDTFDSAEVCAKDEESARQSHPFGYDWIDGKWAIGLLSAVIGWLVKPSTVQNVNSPRKVTGRQVGIALGYGYRRMTSQLRNRK